MNTICGQGKRFKSTPSKYERKLQFNLSFLQSKSKTSSRQFSISYINLEGDVLPLNLH